MMKGKKPLFIFLFAYLLLFIDQLVKVYVHYHIFPTSIASSSYPYGGFAVFSDWYGIDFAITHVINKGAAWGAFAYFHDYLLYVRLLIIGGLFSYLFFVKAGNFRKGCLLLIAMGAIGNVLDTFIYGHVIDMFYFIFWNYRFPVFNLADATIFSGVCLLFFEGITYKLRARFLVRKNEQKTTV